MLPGSGRVKPQRQRDKKKKRKKICMLPDLQQLISGVPSPSHPPSPLSERLSSCSFTPPLIPSLEAALECTPFQSRRPVHVNVPRVFACRACTSLDGRGAFVAYGSPPLPPSPRMLVCCFEGGAPSHSQPLNHFDYGAVLF